MLRVRQGEFPVSLIVRLCLILGLIPSLSAAQAETSKLLLAERDAHPMETREAEPRPQNQQSSMVSPEPAPIFWKPAGVGAPARRVAGGVRGNVALPRPTALVPRQIGLTSRVAPSLFWHLDGATPADVRLFFTLTDAEVASPIAEVELLPPSSAGVQRVSLEEHGVELANDQSYTWSISLVSDMNERSRDIVTMGAIQRREWPQDRPRDAAHFAEFGFWYDALEVLSDAVEARPSEVGPRAQRLSLLEQAHLKIPTD